MKSGCIVLSKNMGNAFHEDVSALINELSISRYAPSEMRVLSAQQLKHALNEFRTLYQVIFVIADERAEIGADFKPMQAEGMYADGKTVVCVFPLANLEKCLQYLDTAQGVQYKSVTFKAVGASLAHVEKLLAQIEANAQGRVICRHAR